MPRSEGAPLEKVTCVRAAVVLNWWLGKSQKQW